MVNDTDAVPDFNGLVISKISRVQRESSACHVEQKDVVKAHVEASDLIETLEVPLPPSASSMQDVMSSLSFLMPPLCCAFCDALRSQARRASKGTKDVQQRPGRAGECRVVEEMLPKLSTHLRDCVVKMSDPVPPSTAQTVAAQSPVLSVLF